MGALSVEELYEKYIKHRSSAERMRLVEITTHDLERSDEVLADQAKHSIMELHGLGAEIWQGIDAQDFVNELRDEWESRA